MVKYNGMPAIRFKTTRRRAALAVCGLMIAGVMALVPLMRASAAQVTIDAETNAAISTWKQNNSPDTVFISDQVGYTFSRGGASTPLNTSGRCIYAKTTDGGTTWSAPALVHDRGNTGCIHISVWYDRWTPGDTTGTLIYIATVDSSTDDIYYNTFDTSTDTLTLAYSTPLALSSDKTNTMTGPANRVSVTKATNGKVYVGLSDAGTAGDQTWVKKCAISCTAAEANWSDTSFSGLQASIRDELLLMPLPSGNMLAIGNDSGADDIVSKVYTDSTNTWDASFTTIDAVAPENTTYAGQLGATLNKSTNDIYLAYVADNAVLGTANDIRTAKYSAGTWTVTGEVLSNETRGVMAVKLALDENTGDLYAVYSARATAATATTGQIFYKTSTNGMTSWGTESAALNTVAQADLYGPRINIMSNERIYVTWHDLNGANADFLAGNTVIDLTATVNSAPAAPTLNTPANAATGVSPTPQFQLRATDTNNDYLRYKIEVCSTSTCSAIVRTIDQTVSQTGWSGQDQQASTAYTGSGVITSSTMATHTYQTPELSAGTQYWWRAYAIDPGGTNTFSTASSIWSFTTGAAPTKVEINGGIELRGGTQFFN